MDMPNRYVVEKHHVLLMLWRSRRLTYDLGRLSKIANLLLRRMRKTNRKVNQNNFPPFPERQTGTTQPPLEEAELLGELKQLCAKIPLIQAIKGMPIYNKMIKEKCFRHLGRHRRDAQTINVIVQLCDLMLGQVIYPKYLHPRSRVVNVHINGIVIPHTLIDLGVAINVMTRDTMHKLNLQRSLRKTTTVLQLADHSTVTPEGIVEYVMVSIDSWEYPADFLVLQPMVKLTVYPLILVRPWLAATDAYNNCPA